MNYMDLRLFLPKNIYNESTIEELKDIISTFANVLKIEPCLDNRMGVIIQFENKELINTYEKMDLVCQNIMLTWISRYYDRINHLVSGVDFRDQVRKIYSIGKFSDDTIIIYL